MGKAHSGLLMGGLPRGYLECGAPWTLSEETGIILPRSQEIADIYSSTSIPHWLRVTPDSWGINTQPTLCAPSHPQVYPLG